MTSQRPYRLTPRGGNRLAYPFSPILYYALIYACVYRIVPYLYPPLPVYFCSLSGVLHVPSVSLPQSRHRNSVLRQVQIMTVVIIELSPAFFTASFIASNIVTSALFSKSPACVLPGLCLTKSHIRTKRRS